MLEKFNSFIEKWMAFVTPACLLTGVLFAGTGGRLRSGTSSVPGQYELYHRNGAGIFRTCSGDQSDVGVHL